MSGGGERDDTHIPRLPPLLTTPEAARLLRVHRNTLDREREAGRVRCVRIGRRVFFTEGQLRDYLDRQSDEQQEPQGGL